MGLRNDYRVSTIVVLCKDCNEDVGLYPARHKCTNIKRPQLPTLCSSTSSAFNSWNHQTPDEEVPELVASSPVSTTVSRQASDRSIESGKWSFFRSSSSSDVKNSVSTPKQQTKRNDEEEEEEEKSVYFENYASNLKNSDSLPDISRSASTPNGKKLWGKMKENEKWKELIAEKKDDSNKTGKLWERIIHATMSNSMEGEEHESGPDSDSDDWEGETHVSRILREYHQSKHSNASLPAWLYDDRTPIVALAKAPVTEEGIQEQVMSRKQSRRLWQTAETHQLTSREKEIQALRTQALKQEDTSFYQKPSVLRSHSERVLPAAGVSLRSSSVRHPFTSEPEEMVYGSTAPRRMHTTRSPATHYNNIPNTRSNTYF